MTPAPHLHKRPNSQNWQLRLMVPKAAQAAIGRREFTKSLGVTDRRRAADLSYAVLASWKAEIDAALAASLSVPPTSSRTPDIRELQDAALEVGFERASGRVAALIQRKAKAGSAAFDTLPKAFEQRHRTAIRSKQAGDHTYWIDRARNILTDRRWSLAEDSPEFVSFVETLAAAGTDTFNYARHLVEGKEDSFVPSKALQTARGRRAACAKSGEKIADLFERYAKQRLAEGRKRPDTVNQDRKVIALFSGFVGQDRSLSSIENSEVREWRNAVAALPPAFRKHKANAGLSLREVTERARATGASGISAYTVNKYLSTISPLFDWARQEGYVNRNPCDGLFFDLQKSKRSGKSRRPPFTVEQLNLIFSSPLFTGFVKDGIEWQPGGIRANDWRFWIPLVCFFTGARIGEIAQLHVDDVREQDGIRYLWIKDDNATGQRTKSGHCRPAPIHSKLIWLGWLRYVESQRSRANEDGDRRLFPELQPNRRGQISWTPSRFWRTYLTHIGIKNGKDGYGSHSFRHGLADQLRLAGYLDDEIEVVLGHNQISVTAGYGQVRQGTVRRLSSMIEAITFSGVDFSTIKAVQEPY